MDKKERGKYKYILRTSYYLSQTMVMYKQGVCKTINITSKPKTNTEIYKPLVAKRLAIKNIRSRIVETMILLICILKLNNNKITKFLKKQ